MLTLKQTFTDIKNDLPNSNNFLKILLISYFFSLSFRILLNHRIGKYFYKKNNILFNFIARYYKTRLISKRGCDISYSAIVGKRLILPHPFGVVFGHDVVIGDDVMIFQQVTLGSHGKRGSIQQEFPKIKSGVKIFAGAKIIGGITIGENAIIGCNAVVNINIPPNSTAVGIPCRIIK